MPALNRFFSWVLALGAIVLAFAGIGYLMPMAQTEQRTVLYTRVDTEDVWNVVSEFENYPHWRSDVDRMQPLAERGDHPVWHESGPEYERTIEVTRSDTDERLMVTFADESQGFLGSWTLDLVEEPSGTRILLTESGVVQNVLKRLWRRVTVDRSAVLDRFLVDVGVALGLKVHPTSPRENALPPGL